MAHVDSEMPCPLAATATARPSDDWRKRSRKLLFARGMRATWGTVPPRGPDSAPLVCSLCWPAMRTPTIMMASKLAQPRHIPYRRTPTIGKREHIALDPLRLSGARFCLLPSSSPPFCLYRGRSWHLGRSVVSSTRSRVGHYSLAIVNARHGCYLDVDSPGASQPIASSF